MRFKEVDSRVSFPALEEEVLGFWEEAKIFAKSLEKNAGGNRFVFFEGPPTANGKPGMHHAMSRYLKDIFPRFKTMQGYKVERKAGWDTHGLPVEIGVEKALGFSGKADIEKYGVAEFNAKAKESVWEYKDLWEKFTKRMGYWLDLDNPYVTYDPKYIESVWWILKQIWDKDLIYLGHRVSPWCPRCGTVLSSHELAQGYQTDKDTSVFVKFKIKNDKLKKGDGDTYLLAWTTTPWTLPGNVALAVGENIPYVQLKIKNDKLQIEENVILAQDLVESVFGKEELEVIQKLSGKDLVGVDYEPLFEGAIPADAVGYGNAFKVVAADFVTTQDGTGIVHTAVMYGEDDYNLGTELGLPKVHTVDKEGKFLPSVAKWAGLPVTSKEVEQGIIADLAERGLLLKTLEYKHEYPHCWRCDTKLIYYATDSWFIAVSRMREQLTANNQTINWVPDHMRDGRFGEWLKEAKDWAISRARYWGTPLPFWVNTQDASDVICVGSYEELAELAGKPEILKQVQDDGGEGWDPHRPIVDEIVLVRDGKEYRRVPEILDVWFDSGAMPFAQWHYPFENKERIEAGISFPADFISEGVDQTRGWFYTMLTISTLLGLGAPYKNVVVNGHILDKSGKKMSKSKGNVVDPWEMFDRHGSDAMRWYLMTINQTGLPKNFDEQGLISVTRRFGLTLWNTYSFFVMYANLDGFVPQAKADLGSPNILDKWILARRDEVVGVVTKALEQYEPMAACLALEAFVGDLSNWYVRRSRRRFWNKGEGSDGVDKQFAYNTLYAVLLDTIKLMAPLMPFVSEAIYQNLKDASDAESVHLADWPVASGVNEEVLVQMQELRAAVELGLNLREKAGIKVRQPLASLSIIQTQMDEQLQGMLCEELNVKNIILGAPEVMLDIDLTPELMQEGVAREVVRQIQVLRKNGGLEILDRIRIEWMADDPIVGQAIATWQDYILNETLGDALLEVPSLEAEALSVAGSMVKLRVTKS